MIWLEKYDLGVILGALVCFGALFYSDNYKGNILGFIISYPLVALLFNNLFDKKRLRK